MGKRVLYCASTASHILNFHLPYLQFFKEQGWSVDVCKAGLGKIPYAENVFELPLKKSLVSISNLHTVYFFKHLLNKNQYDIISTHTALAGAVVRLAVKITGMRCGKIVHTSHGYFFNDGEVITELPYLWVEKFLAPVTDVLMVMNEVDHRLAVKHKLGKKIVAIPGMGVDLAKFSRVNAKEKKKLKVAAGYDPQDFLIVYAAEMSKRKNQGELIQAFALIATKAPSLKLLLAGDGILKGQYEVMIQRYGLNDRIRFLGHVSNMASLYQICDLAVSTSRSEGLPFGIMEAMACGLPVVASRVKGHIDLLDGLQANFLYNLGDKWELANKLLVLCGDVRLREELSKENRMKVQHFSLERVRPMVIEWYKELMGEQ